MRKRSSSKEGRGGGGRRVGRDGNGRRGLSRSTRIGLRLSHHWLEIMQNGESSSYCLNCGCIEWSGWGSDSLCVYGGKSHSVIPPPEIGFKSHCLVTGLGRWTGERKSGVRLPLIPRSTPSFPAISLRLSRIAGSGCNEGLHICSVGVHSFSHQSERRRESTGNGESRKKCKGVFLAAAHTYLRPRNHEYSRRERSCKGISSPTQKEQRRGKRRGGYFHE